MRVVYAPVEAVRRARAGVRRAATRRRLEAVASGKSSVAPPTLDEPDVDVAGVIDEITAGLQADSVPVGRLVAALKNSGAVDQVIESLEARPIHTRTAAVRTVGALRMYEAVPSVAPLLASRERPVVDASARTLGRIGGVNSATSLLTALQRRGVSRRLVAELARGAPDLFVEVALAEPLKPGLRPALALAAGLRRRRTAIAQLTALVENGTRRERAISCRALGWIGASTAVPMITEALSDRDWKLRMSAAKALCALDAQASLPDLRYLFADQHPRVRKAAHAAVRRIERDIRGGHGHGA